MHPMLNIAVRAARAAGTKINYNFEERDNLTVAEKGHNDLVTNVDRECEKVITETLLKSYPTHCVVGEEFGKVGNLESDHVWYIDPIDGTTNFFKGIPHVAVSIGLRVRGVTTVGVVFDPLRNELFTAARGEGAQLNGRRIRASDNREFSSAIIATAYPHRMRQFTELFRPIFNKVFDRCADFRRAGTASLDLAYVAAGRLDGYYEIGLKQWDFCAGELLCREAGVIVTDFFGGSDYYNNGTIVCGNPYIVKELLKEIDPKSLPEGFRGIKIK